MSAASEQLPSNATVVVVRSKPTFNLCDLTEDEVIVILRGLESQAHSARARVLRAKIHAQLPALTMG